MSRIDPTQSFHDLPLPLAQLALRARNAKSSVDRHAIVYCLAEAALKLCAMTRIGLWATERPGEGRAREARSTSRDR